MDTLQPLLKSLQGFFSRSEAKGGLLSKIILAMILPIGNAKGSSLYKKLLIVLGYSITKTRFYRFLACKCMRWDKLWQYVFKLIPNPLEKGRLILGLDDSINPKSGKKIFGCEKFFDHAAKHNQSRYPWAQNLIKIGLLKWVHSRWALLPLLARFHHSSKAVESQAFKTKIEQAREMILKIASWCKKAPVLVVVDAWFGNGSLYLPLKEALGSRIQILSMLKKNSNLFDLPKPEAIKRRGRPKKYGDKAGSVRALGKRYESRASVMRTFVYGKQRDIKVYTGIWMSRSLRCEIKVVFAYYRNSFVALMSTDLNLSAEEIVEYYSARWKIESGFKELKHDIGSQACQARTKTSVINHLNMCMLAITIVWIATLNLSEHDRHVLIQSEKQPYSFSKAQKLVIELMNKSRFCDSTGFQLKKCKNSLLDLILKIAA